MRAAPALTAEAETTAGERTSSARQKDEEVHNPETPPRAEDYFGYETAGSRAASSVSKEHSSEDSQEEYSQDGFLYHRDNTSRHGHRDHEEYFPEHPDHAEERLAQLDKAPPLFSEAAQTDAYDFFKGAHELTLPSRAKSAPWLEGTTANALAQGQVIPKLCFNNMSRTSWKTLLSQPLGYYVVETTYARNGTTILRLDHENEGTEHLPKMIFLEHRAEDRRILVLSDAAIASERLGTAVMKALTRNSKVTLTSPSNPRGVEEAGPSTQGNDQLAKITNGDPAIKVSDPAMLAKIKISQLNTNLEDLPIADQAACNDSVYVNRLQRSRFQSRCVAYCALP